MVPLFISLWGVNKYADWIILSALSSFFTMADVGLNTVTINQFVIKYQQKEYIQCSKLLMNAFLFIATTGFCVIIMSIGFSFLFDIKKLLHVSVFSAHETIFIFIVLLLGVFLQMYVAVYNGIYRATSHAHVFLIIHHFIRLLELLILSIGVIFNLNMYLLMFLYIIPEFIAIILIHLYAKKWFDFKYSIRLFDAPLLKSLIKPSFSFMLMPLGYAISNQGMILIISNLLGAVILVIFTTTRTLVNFIYSAMGVLSTAVWPEISVAYGRKDKKILSALYKHSLIITAILAFVCIFILVFAGEPIYLIWTRHAIAFDAIFFYGMLFTLFIAALWGIASVLPLATNNHGSFSVVFLISQSASVLLTYISLSIYPHLSVVPIAISFSGLFLCWFLFRSNHLLLRKTG
jgi:O-antigen/teichoic acid export membrane protein